MAIKLIAVDMDDTLLNTSLTISPQTQRVLRQAAAEGIKVTIATGRMYCSALPFARELGIEVPLITYNGALIKNSLSGEILLHQPIEAALAAKVLALFREHGWYIQSYVDDVLYVEKREEHALYYEKLAGVQAVAVGNALYERQQQPTKLLAMLEVGQMDSVKALVQKAFGEQLMVTNSKPTYLEMINPSVNKGLALAQLADRLGIKADEVMAIGDSNNDLDMLRYAGCGVAMGNAAKHVQAVADFVTKSNDEDGVAEAVLKYALHGKS